VLHSLNRLNSRKFSALRLLLLRGTPVPPNSRSPYSYFFQPFRPVPRLHPAPPRFCHHIPLCVPPDIKAGFCLKGPAGRLTLQLSLRSRSPAPGTPLSLPDAPIMMFSARLSAARCLCGPGWATAATAAALHPAASRAGRRRERVDHVPLATRPPCCLRRAFRPQYAKDLWSTRCKQRC
jgi:hypothetical protein